MDISKKEQQQQWMLSFWERQYLTGKDITNEQKRRRTIRNKRVPYIGDRIQHLVDDVSLLERAGYLNFERDFFEGYERNFLSESDITFDPRLDERHRNVWYPFCPPENHPEKSLGLTFGQLTKTLTSDAWSSVDYNELIWAFILGLCGENEGLEAEFQNDVDRLLEFIENRKKQRNESPKTRPVTPQRIEEVFAKPEETVERKTPSIQEEIRRIRSDSLQYDPASITPNIMEEIDYSVSETRRFLLFEERLTQHANEITEIQWNGVDAPEVLHQLELSSGESSTREIMDLYNQRNDDTITDKRTVSKILADLSGQDRDQKRKIESEKWAENPVVKEIKSGKRRGRKWDITTYGYIVTQRIVARRGLEVIRRDIAEILVNGGPETKYQRKLRDAVKQVTEQ